MERGQRQEVPMQEQGESVDFKERIIHELHDGLESQDQGRVVAALKELGIKLHKEIKCTVDSHASFDEDQNKYVLGITSMTRGARIFINTKSYDAHPQQLIFPTDIPGGHKKESEAFEKLFDGKVENKGTAAEPYWTVDLGIEVPPEEEE